MQGLMRGGVVPAGGHAPRTLTAQPSWRSHSRARLIVFTAARLLNNSNFTVNYIEQSLTLDYPP